MNLKSFVFVLSIWLISSQILAQSNLQFSQVINLSGGQSYTVPNGAVFKLESINQNTGSISLPYAGNCMINCPSCGVSSGVTCYYNGLTYFSIGSYQLVKGADNTYVNSGGSCSVCPASKSISITLPTLNLPIWLKAGEVITTHVSGSHISGLEFLLN
jgi:hypothetical protein